MLADFMLQPTMKTGLMRILSFLDSVYGAPTHTDRSLLQLRTTRWSQLLKIFPVPLKSSRDCFWFTLDLFSLNAADDVSRLTSLIYFQSLWNLMYEDTASSCSLRFFSPNSSFGPALFHTDSSGCQTAIDFWINRKLRENEWKWLGIGSAQEKCQVLQVGVDHDPCQKF